MNAELRQIEEKLGRLIDTLDGHDAGAIVAATEALAADVARLRNAGITPLHASAQAATHSSMIDAILGKLTHASVRANMHRAWTRQRLDGVIAVRSSGVTALAIKY